MVTELHNANDDVLGSIGGRPFPQTIVSAWDVNDCGGGRQSFFLFLLFLALRVFG